MTATPGASPRQVVVIGGGLAGAKTVEALRARGFDGRITLVGEEADLPYERPPLSKSYLSSTSPFADAVVHPERWYAEQQVDLILGTAATDLDAAGQAVTLTDGRRLEFDRLVLATGAAPRRITVPGADAPGVHYLRSRGDAEAVRATFGVDRHLVIIGGGWIGLEVAAAARNAGTAVTVLEAAQLPLLAVLGPELATVFAELHRENGVLLQTGAAVSGIPTDATGVAAGVRLADGTTIEASAVVVGVGVLPRVQLAQGAGLEVGNGVLVDTALRTSDPRIAAVGDIANHAHPTLHARIRVEHWATALNQPATAVAALLGDDVSYRALPYFYSDQYDLGMEYLGYAPRGSYCRVTVRGSLATRRFVAFWQDERNRIKAAMNVNVWDVPDTVRPLIEAGTGVSPDQLADTGVELADLTGSTGLAS